MPSPPLFVDTPRGLFTANGTWYRTTVAQLRAYAEPVVEAVGIEALIARADETLAAPRTLALTALPLLLLGLAPIWAAPIALGLAVAAFVWTPLLTGPTIGRAWKALGLVPVQLVLYLFVLSFLAAQNLFASVAAGLIGFVILRWGLVDWALGKTLDPLFARLHKLTRPDAVLRALIVRSALHSGIPHDKVEAMQRDLIRLLPRR